MWEEKNEMLLDGFFFRCMVTYAVTILAVLLTGRMFGEGAKKFSTMYQLGNQGLAFETLMQLLVSSAAISFVFGLQFIKKLMFVWRSVVVVTLVTAIVIFCAWIFKWFPMKDAYAWAGFLISYGLCTLLSTAIVLIQLKLKKKKYEKLLKAYKEDQIL